MKTELEAYKDASWDFMLEHCDITNGGSLFIKFHCDHRKNFERRVYARMRGYHREDVRAKEQVHVDTKRVFKENRLKKRSQFVLAREERIKVFEKIKRANERRIRWRRLLRFFDRISHRLLRKGSGGGVPQGKHDSSPKTEEAHESVAQ